MQPLLRDCLERLLLVRTHNTHHPLYILILHRIDTSNTIQLFLVPAPSGGLFGAPGKLI